MNENRIDVIQAIATYIYEYERENNSGKDNLKRVEENDNHTQDSDETEDNRIS